MADKSERKARRISVHVRAYSMSLVHLGDADLQIAAVALEIGSAPVGQPSSWCSIQKEFKGSSAMTAFSVPLDVDLSPDQLFGYLACGLVLATFAMRSMQGLRYIAILSNVAFIYYAGALSLMPIFILHAILLPLNLWRLIEIWTEKTKPAPDEASDIRMVPPVVKEFYGSRAAAQLVIAASEGERRHRGER